MGSQFVHLMELADSHKGQVYRLHPGGHSVTSISERSTRLAHFLSQPIIS